MLNDNEITNEQQLQDENWLRCEMEEHAIELKVHALRLASYKRNLAALVGKTSAQSFYEELRKW
jgi:hypothetical protein